MIRIASWAGVLLAFASPLSAAEYYVAPNGVASNDGSITRPLDLASALSSSSPARPGDTIWLRGGTYTGNFVSDLTGTAGAPIVVRQYPGERATIDGAAPSSTTPALTVRGADAWYWGFEITNSNPIRSTAGTYNPPRATSVWVLGARTKFINLVVHDGEQGFGFWTSAIDSELYGNLVYYVGFDGDNRGNGHSVYAQNETGVKRIIDNIMFSGFAFGFHGYTSNAHLDHFHIAGNTIFNHGVLSLNGGVKANVYIGGGDDADYPVVSDNYLYYSPFTSAGRNIDLRPSCLNGTVTGNYAAGGTAMSIYCLSTTVTGNFFAGRTFTDTPYPDNTYLTTVPTGLRVFVRPNQYEPGARANITVFNWDRLPSVAVDLAQSGLAPGAQFEIRDAQNFFGPPVASGTWNGSPVQIPMSGLTVATPVGNVPRMPTHTAPEFGAFVLLRTSGASPAPPTATLSAVPPSISAGQSSTLSWSVTNATSVSINQGIGSVAASGSRTVSPTATTTYTLTASNSVGTVTRTATVTVGAAGGSATATFLQADTISQGTWRGTYGADGYTLAGDTAALPAYASVTFSGPSVWTWSANTSDVRALQRPSGTGRFAATWYVNGGAGANFAADIAITDGQPHRVALQMIDWDNGGRAQTIEVRDATSNALLDSRQVAGFGGGIYLVWELRGTVRFRVIQTGGINPVLSAIFFDPGSGSAIPAPPTNLRIVP